MEKLTAEEVLDRMIGVFGGYLDDLKDYRDVPGERFQYGERVAYTECLELVQLWKGAAKRGLNYDIEKKYPL